MKIFLYGPPGSGKTSLGISLAKALDLPFLDLDQEIGIRSDASISNLFTDYGEAGFRQIEQQVLKETCQRRTPGIVALGGGALLNPDNRLLVEKAGSILCLNAPFEVLLERLQTSGERRPLISETSWPSLGQNVEDQKLAKLLGQREAHYGSFDLQLNTNTPNMDDLVWKAQVSSGAFLVNGLASSYNVNCQPGCLDWLSEWLLFRDLHGPIAIVTDQNVGPLYTYQVANNLNEQGFTVSTITISAGESYKNIETINYLWEKFVDSGLERSSTVVALGGGVVNDLAGFAAATYMRGIHWVTIPTSLLAMVDASLGGKTGADLNKGKNLIGAFHSPRLVIADLNTLSTLPEKEICNGLAEVVKASLIGDPGLLSKCQKGLESVKNNWPEIIRRAMAVKIRIIQQDPREKNIRSLLNLGHTFGHALEMVSNFKISHGEAVAIGMVLSARVSERMGFAKSGLTDLITQTLDLLHLPVEIPLGIEKSKLIEAMRSDKKRKSNKLRLVLPIEPGNVIWGVEVDEWNLF